MTVSGNEVTVVVPTVGRPSLARTLESLAAARGPLPRAVVVVDDRRRPAGPLCPAPPARLSGRLWVLPAGGRGPAAARNVGWRAAGGDWVAFLDDDVEVGPRWLADLVADLDVPATVAGVQGRIRVPRPTGRAPTDWERDVAGLERARWATADCAYRRAALAAVGGFDEGFPRAYREDADLGLRITAQAGRIERGRRTVVHPVRPAGRWVRVRRQAGNADDARMRRLHGPGWRVQAGVPAGRRPRHVTVVAAALGGLGGLAVSRTRPAGIAALVVWLAGTLEFAGARIAPGPRDRGEVTAMALTSPVIPFAAVWHWTRGWVTSRPRRGRAPRATRPAALLFDRDGTLVVDRPYNGDPEKVELMPGARQALQRARDAQVPVAVISNQSGVGRGLLSLADVDAVNLRIEELLGPVGPWAVCPHEPGEGCTCRKPRGGLVRRAAQQLGVPAHECVVIGDVGADAQAAHAAGARAVLVPTAVTRAEEYVLADAVAADLPAAVDVALRWGGDG